MQLPTPIERQGMEPRLAAVGGVLCDEAPSWLYLAPSLYRTVF